MVILEHAMLHMIVWTGALWTHVESLGLKSTNRTLIRLTEDVKGYRTGPFLHVIHNRNTVVLMCILVHMSVLYLMRYVTFIDRTLSMTLDVVLH
jgi:hypothetical protein